MMMCDAKTENGIPYVSSLYASNFNYQTVVDDLDSLYPVRMKLVSGEGTIQSYKIGTRSLTRGQLSSGSVLDLWEKLMRKKEQMEAGRRPRRSIAVVNRDW